MSGLTYLRIARITVVTKIVELETRLFALPFLTNGSLYYTKDLQECNKVDVPVASSAKISHFCICPDTRLSL
jgi:hypothetical protein